MTGGGGFGSKVTSSFIWIFQTLFLGKVGYIISDSMDRVDWYFWKGILYEPN